ncbi:MAG: T9SS type A sorting domain-containing protein, partial [Muribaculaceae bacterium]|nr:T9SS type A sorting domain-containing protein [Muribaculaceae bacterium]
TDCTIEAMEVRSTDIGLTSSLSDHYFDFYAAEAGVYYIGIHGCDDKPSKGTYANTFSLASIKVDSSKRLPAAVSDLTAVPAADESLNIELSWTNPTVSFAGDAMSRDEYKVLVYLDGELALTLDGEQLVEGTQTATLPVPSTGVYTVKVQTVALDDEASSVDIHPTATTSWVGPRTVALPYTADFTAGEHPSFAIWSIIDGNNDGKTWTIDLQYGKAAKLNGSTLSDGLYKYDDYLLTPDFELTPGTYAVTVLASGATSTNPFFFNLGAFKSGEFSTDKANWTAHKQFKVGGYSYVECTFEFTITEAGRYQVVIAADEAFLSQIYTHLSVRKFDIKAVVALPEIATDVTVTPGADFALEAIVKWTNPTATSFEGVALAEGDITKAVIYRNGEEVGVVEEDLIPGLEASFTDDTLVAGGVYTYKVEIYTANGCSETPATEVKSTWIGPGILIPENSDGLCYGPDWEDGPFAGWTIVDANNTKKVLEVSWTYGLGITSNNITPDCYAYSRPIQFEKSNIYRVVVDSHYNFDVLGEVTPELHYGTSEDVAEFVKVGEWSIPETCTSRTKLHTATFYLYAVDASELEAQTEEAGDDELISKSVKIPAGAVRLALRANDKGSYYLRNIEIRREKSFTGVDAVGVAEGIAYSAEGITFDGEAAVEVYSLTGMLVAADAHAEGRFDLSTVAKGVYVVRVSHVNGKTVTLKIVK